MALVRQGWPAAFEAVYNRHHRGILSFCRHVLSDADEAEDAVQHTFLAAYNDLIGSDKPIHLRAWLFTIARNRCYSILRSRREQPAADLDEPVTEGLAVQVQRRQDLRDLVVDLRSLPDEQRAALVLAELDALSHEEIGEALGVPREKVKALVFQARESLVASRMARETACTDIREQLSAGRGGALRRANLRRHLRDCAGCRDFRRQVERQRRQIAAVLPVVPTLALREAVLTGTGTAGAGFSGSGLLAVKSGLFKGFAALMLATAGTAGTYVATHDFRAPARLGAPRRPHPIAPPAAVPAAGLAPSVHRVITPAPPVSHAVAVTRPELRHALVVRQMPVATPVRAGNGVVNPFGPLVHSRFPFPHRHSSRRQSIAPPKSTGQVIPAVPAPPVAVLSTPVATITSTLTAPAPVDPKPVADQPSADAPSPATGTRGASARGTSRSAASARTRAVRGRAGQGETVPSRRPSVRAAVPTRGPAVRPAGRTPSPAPAAKKSPVKRVGPPVLAPATPRVVAVPVRTAPATSDAGARTRTTDPGAGAAQSPSRTSTTTTSTTPGTTSAAPPTGTHA